MDPCVASNTRWSFRHPVSRTLRWWLKLSVCLLLLGPGAASASAEDAAQKAAEHFDRATAALDRHDYPAAIRELESALALRPHPTVLYNLAVAYAMNAQPREAHAAYGRYLSDYGADLSGQRRGAISSAQRAQAAKLAEVQILVEPITAQLTLDGSPVAARKAILVEPGKHTLRASANGYEARNLPFSVSAGAKRELHLSLVPQHPQPPRPRSARLFLICPIPDVDVVVDGQRLSASEPAAVRAGFLHSLSITPGVHSVKLTREGFRPERFAVAVREGDDQTHRCRMQPASLDRSQVGWLRFPTLPTAARVLVNGTLYSGQPLPKGRHHVGVELWGYHPWQSTIIVEPGERRDVQVDLVPTRKQVQAIERRQRRRTTSYVLLGSGLSAGVAATLLLVYNNQRAERWTDAQADIEADLLAGRDSGVLQQRQQENDELADSIHNLDAAIVGIGVAGAALLTGGALTYALSEDVDLAATPQRFTLTGVW